MRTNNRNRERERLLSRQSAIMPDVADMTVAMIGLGGIGSNVADTLARIGFQHFILVDPDRVEEENVYPGAFDLRDVGSEKVEAMSRILVGLGVPLQQIRTETYRVDNDHDVPIADIVVVGPDNMACRRDVWQQLSIYGNTELALCGLLIDARMGGVGFEIHCVERGDGETGALYNQDVANLQDQPLACGQKATAFVTRLIAGTVGAWVRDWLVGKTPPAVTIFDADGRVFAAS
jgi:molybdopterin/thiamine biosynthesis adenylyltransferase